LAEVREAEAEFADNASPSYEYVDCLLAVLWDAR
jgi:hypothetical protein